MANVYAADLYQGRIENESHDCRWVPWELRKGQLVQFVRTLWPSSTACEIFDRIDASDNEVILLNVGLPVPNDVTASDWLNLAIRLPHQGSDTSRLSEGQREKYDKGELPADEMPTVVLGRGTLDSVAIHQHVAAVTSTTGIRLPKLIAYDSTKDNHFHNEYIIMERIPGQPLEDVLDDLSGEKRLVLAKELGEIMNSLRQVTSPDAGYIRASKSQNWPAYINPGQPLPHFSPDIIQFGLNSDHISASDLDPKDSNLPLREMFNRAWTRRIDKHAGDYPQDTQTVLEYSNLRDMAQGYIDGGKALDTGEFCLVHGDLFPRNIMVDVEASPMITGIIDWDEALYGPTLVSAIAPFWLWLIRDDGDKVAQENDGNGSAVDEERGHDKASDDDKNNEDAGVVERHDDVFEDGEDEESVFGDEDETVDRANEVPGDPELRSVRETFAATVGDEIWASSVRSDDINLRWLFALVVRDNWPYWWHDISSTMVEAWKASMHHNEEDLDEDEDGSNDGNSEDGIDEDGSDEDGSDEDRSDEDGSDETGSFNIYGIGKDMTGK